MNIYEQWTYDALEQEGFAAFLPYKDRGVDCVVTEHDFTGFPKRVQIKGSRTYGGRGAWFQPSVKNVRGSNTDFWVFVGMRTTAKGQLKPAFLIVPTPELTTRLASYAAESKDRYNIYLEHNEPEHPGMIVDTRAGKAVWGAKDPWPIPSGSPWDYTAYLNNWGQLRAAIGGAVIASPTRQVSSVPGPTP